MDFFIITSAKIKDKQKHDYGHWGALIIVFSFMTFGSEGSKIGFLEAQLLAI